jgi:ribonuclease BN (tRNA processing enzyme)
MDKDRALIGVITLDFKILSNIRLREDISMLNARSRPFSVRWGAVLVVFLVACAPALAGDNDRCGVNGIALQVLGSGGPELQDKRASSSYLLWWNGRARVLVDIGGGAALRFGQSGATVTGLDVILLTHLHVDHVGDLPALVKSSYFEDRRAALPVFGPGGNSDFPSTTRFIRDLFTAPQGAFRYLSDFVTPAQAGGYLLQPHDVLLKAREVRPLFDDQGIRVAATTVIHGGVPALAYRVDLGGVSVAFSGDTNGNNGNLEHLAEAADVLVAHNAIPEGAQGVERALHMPPSVIGRIARDAGVKRLILSHRMRRTLGREDETMLAIRESFAGSTTFANDLDCFPIP